MTGPAQSFHIHVPQNDLDDLADRLARTRWPEVLANPTWAWGMDAGYLRELVDWWRTSFDWRHQECNLNRFRQYRVKLDGLGVHFVHERGVGPRPMPLLISHGWPSTFFEMSKIIPRLTDPARYGADPADSFDVVVPSLPGYAFSDAPQHTGIAWQLPTLWIRLMSEVLGYGRFGAHGVDIGGFLTNRLGLDYPEHLVGIHVTQWPEPCVEGDLTADETRYIEARAAGNEAELGYAHVQRTKPWSLAYGLLDSPVGLAAWLVDKWCAWSDCDGDIERRFTKDELLTTVMLYWVTRTIGSSFQLYREWGLASRPYPWMPPTDAPPGAAESTPLPPGRRIDVPAAVALSLNYGPTIPPVSWLQRSYTQPQVIHMPRGGHFPAMEEPDLLVESLRSFFRPLRQPPP